MFELTWTAEHVHLSCAKVVVLRSSSPGIIIWTSSSVSSSWSDMLGVLGRLSTLFASRLLRLTNLWILRGWRYSCLDPSRGENSDYYFLFWPLLLDHPDSLVITIANLSPSTTSTAGCNGTDGTGCHCHKLVHFVQDIPGAPLERIYLTHSAPDHLIISIRQFSTRPKDPLSHIPGPWYTKHTSLIFTLNALIPQVHVYVHKLHIKYGPVVRITPEMVAIADPDGVADIYRSSRGYLKGPVYESLLRSFFATTDPVLHGQRRRLFARPLANSSIQTFWAEDVRKRVVRTVQRIKKDAESDGEGDAYKWFNIMANDVITTLSFGDSLNLLESDEVGSILCSRLER